MTVLQAVILGVVQGLTEFLPVSSSGHLVILQHFFGLGGPILLVFDVVVHVGTLLAILVFFRREFFPIPKIGARMFWLVVLATVPTGIIGLLLKDWVEAHLATLRPIAVALFINSIILWSTCWRKTEGNSKIKNPFHALWIGVIQGISVIPGISRVGSTVSGGLWLGLEREEAVRFSFFIAIPAILAATVLIVPESVRSMTPGMWPVIAAGFLAAFCSGYLAISVLFKIVSRGKFHYFAIYTLLAAVFVFLFSQSP